jgi:Domain of unknown function (DUF4382)
MKIRFNQLIAVGMLMLAITVFYACSKESSVNGATDIPPGKANLSVYLTDGPVDFQKVLIDIQSIDVKIDTCKKFGDEDDDENEEHEGNDDSSRHCVYWTSLSVKPGQYDLLQLRNGTDTLLGATTIPEGKIKAVKITLGTNNGVVVDSVLYPIKLWKDKNYVVIKIRNEHLEEIASNDFKLFLDFNLAKSVLFNNGNFWLLPNLRPFCHKNTGEIEGRVGPDSAFGLIAAIKGTDTSYALPNRHKEGAFKIVGLTDGSYAVVISGRNGYLDSTISNVQVVKGKETDLGKILLHK